ncbi:MAG TPA: transglycosylase SLT domain-containing protein [Rhizomicrobium sp.]
MDTVTAASLCALFFSQPDSAPPCSPPSSAADVRHDQRISQRIERWRPLIAEAARRFDIPEEWIVAVMRLESGGFTVLDGRPITSRAGAMGLMQLMPGTYADMRARYGLGPDPYDARDSVFAGAAYLREMFVRYGYPDLFAAYHAGSVRLDAFLAGLKPLPQATQSYLASIVPGLENPALQPQILASKPAKTSPDRLFFVRAGMGNIPLDASKSPPKIANSGAADVPNLGPKGREAVSPAAREGHGLFVPLTQSARM